MKSYRKIQIKKIEIVFKVIIATVIISLMTSSILFTPHNSLIGQTLEEELQQIKKDSEAAQKKIQEANKQVQAYTKQVNEVESQLISSLSQLDELNAKLAQAKSDVDKTTIDLVLKEQELKKIQDELDGKMVILNNRVASIYKNGSGNILVILFKAQDFIEFISRLKLMTLLASQDAKIIQEIKDKRSANLNIKKGILDLRDKQKEYQNNIAKLVSQAEKKNNEIEDIYNEKNNLLSGARADKDALLDMAKELEIKESEINRILESYKYGNAPGDKFMWPVAGFIRSGFGMRRHPILGVMRFHAGLDIVAPNGTLVKAADGGEVIQAGYDGAYGNSIVIYHGGGFATWYAHLSSIRVTAGQIVARGQVIGLVGATGLATGPHLHFEVRINGAAQNPLQYLQ